MELEGIPLRIVQAVALALLAFHLVHLALSGVFMDEAYYWMWGQHPALGYFDHPGLNAWLLGLSAAVFGWDKFALRLPVALAFLADAFAIYLFARRIAGEAWRGYFWLTLLLFLVTPIYWMVTIVAVPDHLLLTTSLFAIYFFFRFFQDRATGSEGSSRDLYLGALVLGLAGLTKYNAAFLAVGVAVFVLLYDRRLLGQPRLYLAALLTLLLQAPTIVWNLTENFASWAFILHGRHAGLHAEVDGLYPFIGGVLIFISPFLFWPIGKFIFARKTIVPGMGFARTSFVISSVAIFAVALTTLTLFHWNLIAYAAMLPFLAIYVRPRFLVVLQVLYGITFAVLAFVNYSVVPLTDQRWRDEATAWSYGWSDIAIAAKQAADANHVGFIAATDYTNASLLGFAMGNRDVTSLSPHAEAYDYWFDAAAHTGQDAILYSDSWRPLLGAISDQFVSVTPLQSFTTVVGERSLDTRQLYLAKGFKPNG